MNAFARVALLSAVALATHAADQTVHRTPLPNDHPLLGVWRIDLPNGCFEEYELRSDGTKSSRSGEERDESEIEISSVPSASGFYKWTDRITKVNGKPDCLGSITPLGDVAVNYIRLLPGGNRFLLCKAEGMTSCYAEFYRKTVRA